MSFDTIYDFILWFREHSTKIQNIPITIKANIHDEQLTFDVYFLKDTIFNSNEDVSKLFSKCKEDSNTQLIIANKIVIQNDVTFTPNYRCRGIIIFADTIINNGKISMTARGAKGDGNNLYLYKLNNEYQIVPKDGALGADRVDIYAKWNGPWAANPGYDGIGRQTGGGANGAQGHGDGDWDSWIYTMGGGQGSSYSGGAGSGGADINHPGTWTILKPEPGTGAGTDGLGLRWSSSWYNRNGGGGAGNPGGRGRYASGYNTALDGESGTGGLIIIYTNKISGSGSFIAEGSKGGSGNHGGGGSGGGSINIFTKEPLENPIYSVAGGTSKSNGGKGGNGTFSQDIIPEISEFNIKFNKLNSDIYKNIKDNQKEFNYSYMFGD